LVRRIGRRTLPLARQGQCHRRGDGRPLVLTA
jgi:hypothetical protein